MKIVMETRQTVSFISPLCKLTIGNSRLQGNLSKYINFKLILSVYLQREYYKTTQGYQFADEGYTD